jgi:hypothetical protein
VRAAGVVPNPIGAEEWPLVHKEDDYLLWVGRMTAANGPHRAIATARDAGMPLTMSIRGPEPCGLVMLASLIGRARAIIRGTRPRPRART